MTTENDAPPTADRPRSTGRGRRATLVLAGALALGLTGTLATAALSDGFRFGPPAWHGGGWHGGGWGGGFPGFRSGQMDPAAVEDRVERMVKHLAVELDATSEQQDRLVAIAVAAVKELAPMREQMQAAHERARTLLTAPTVDRAAIEAFRAEQLAAADQLSRRIAQAIGDAAEVLTAEQRQTLGERLDAMRAFRRGG